jgi:hypothetical protein
MCKASEEAYIREDETHDGSQTDSSGSSTFAASKKFWSSLGQDTTETYDGAILWIKP